MLRCDSHSAVYDDELCPVLHSTYADRYAPSGWRELDSIVQKNQQELLEKPCITKDYRLLELLDVQSHATGRCERCGDRSRIDRNIVQEDALAGDLSLAGIRACKRQYVIDDL